MASDDRELLLIDEASVRAVTTRPGVMAAVRRALIAAASGEGELFPVAQGRGYDEGTTFSLKSGRLGNTAVGFKCGTYWPGNGAAGLPTHGSTAMLLDPATGFPRALVAAAWLNGLRTAAADAIAVEELARGDAATLLIVGAGHQAEEEVRALLRVRPFNRVLAWNRSPARLQHLVERLADAVTVRPVELEAGVRQADVIVTATPSREPLVQDAWVRPGTHISAMGADQPGKRELAPSLLGRAALFADLPAQSVRIGEFEGRDADALVPIGDVVRRLHPGRTSSEAITIFDSSGIALQDLAVATMVVEAATAAGLGQRVRF